MSEQSLVLALNLDEVGHSSTASVQAAFEAESAGFHAVSFSEAGLLDAVQRATFVAARTHRIGLLPVIDALYTEPFHTATQLASLDSISHGRAGWILAADNTPAQAAAVGRPVLEPEAISQELADVVITHRRLWDSWEQDAVIRDVATGRYLDADKVHYVDVQGQNFFVKGPAITPRPPQGQLPIIASRQFVDETRLRHCRLNGTDVVALNATTLPALIEQAASARAGGAVAIELEVYLDHAGQSGAFRLAQRAAASERAVYAGSAQGLIQLLADFAQATANPEDQRRHLVHLHPGELAVDLQHLADSVIPGLHTANLLAPVHPTLRESFVLPVAQNRFQEAS
ncbi:LLM class flavin-dependent oxidoreductase [Glutamicibacter sp. NPDC087344]|uniref:LLM class flavin-dependent oxidoreductase n=1 Tax=Glutamicibacter sp. NPDC087344 TaxID=3363994 RepID=UPI0037FD9E96